MKIANPEYTVDRIVQRMREAVARSSPPSAGPKAENLPVSVTATELDSELDIQPISLQPEFRPQPDDRYHVNDLLRFNDRQFVLNAYRAVLKRQADESGYYEFLERLRSGELNKIDVLARLRFSEEGRQRNVQIEGLSFPSTMRRIYRLPLIGYLANLLVAIARLPAMQRSHREFEAHTLAQSEILVGQINHIGSAVTDFARRTSVLLAERASIMSQLAEELAHTSSTQNARVAHLSSYFEDRINNESAQRQEGLGAINDLMNQTSAQTEELRGFVSELTNRSEKIDATVGELNSKIEQARTDFTQSAERLHGRIVDLAASSRAQVGDLARDLAGEVSSIRRLQREFTTELVAHGQRVARLLEQADVSVAPQMQHEREHLLDSFYASFDDQFRGDPGEIKRRLTVYLPYILRARENSDLPIVDVGSGRGEWLELLKENGIAAKGVELNSVLVRQSKDRGLEVIEGDLLDYLHGTAGESVSVVTGFHVAEHLTVEGLVDFLGEASRVLCPGGLLILETPNPRNVLVGSCNFYFDPTHRNPLPDEVLKFLVESRGFSEVEVLPLNPSDQQPVAGNDELTKRFNHYFYGPMDYGLIGWKP